MRAPAPVADEWIADQIESLYRSCRFIPEGEPFLLDPAGFDAIGNPRDQAVYLLTRHRIRHADVAIYLHGHLRRGGRACSGLAEYPFTFDTSALGPHEKLLSVSREGTYAVLDSSDPERPIVRAHSTPVPLSRRRAAIFLDQALLNQKECLGAVIGHEVAHLYLFDRGVHKPTLSRELTDEYQTDLAMFVMGLGPIALRASAAGTGYLSHRQMSLAQDRVVALMRSSPGEPPFTPGRGMIGEVNA